MFGREVELDDENTKLSERIESLEETIAELRAELAEMIMYRDNAVANQEALEDLLIDTKVNYDWFVNHSKKVVE